MQIEERVPLAPKTTFQIGGSARFFARAETLEELREALAFAREKQIPLFILGGGSNVLVDDDGFDGLVLQIAITGITSEKNDTLVAAAGERFDALVACAVDEGRWGLENLSGIPGSVGGAVVQNVGAYGAALSQTIEWVEALDMTTGGVQTFSNAECRFSYRDSVFKRGNLIVLRAAFALSKTSAPNLSYKDLAERFAGQMPALQEIRETVLAIRQRKFPDLAREGTAGSFFKNPIVSSAQAEVLAQKLPGLPLFALPETEGVKVPLAYLLDKGLHLKGWCAGRARLFEAQPLVIAAAHNASSSDVESLAQDVAQKIFDAYALAIEREVVSVRTNNQ